MSRVRSWLAAPLGARLMGVALAVAGVALLVLGAVTLSSGGDGSSGAAPAPSTAAPSSEPGGSAVTVPPTGSATASPTPVSPSTVSPSTVSPSTVSPSTGEPSPPSTGERSSAPPPAAARVPLTVLNNSTISGLGDRAAAEARAKGWTVASVGNFAGRIPVSTVYFTPGNAAEERAARLLAADLPQVDRVYPRYEGLPPTPTGVVLVVTRDWS